MLSKGWYVMNSLGMGKKWYPAGAAMGFAAVCIATILSGCQDEPQQSMGVLPLNNLVTAAEQRPTDTAADDLESGQIAMPKQPRLNAAAKNNLPRWHTVRMRVTAYCPCTLCCGRKAEGITANGHIIRRGDRFVAAPKQYSFGTEIIVPHYNGAQPIKVLDRGGAIKGNRLDLFFASHTRAAKWGIKYLNVKVRTNRQEESGNQQPI